MDTTMFNFTNKINLNSIKNSIKSIDLIETLSAIDKAIDKGDAVYTTACQKAQDKSVDTVLETTKIVKNKVISWLTQS